MKDMGKWFRVTCLAGLAVSLGLGLLMPACAPTVQTPPPPPVPSEVVSRDGMAFYVTGLRLPGTFQEIKLRQAGGETWLPLDQIRGIRFQGPVRDSYRRAQIILTGGDVMKGELFVDSLIEGTTDQGYWNLPLSKVERLEFGSN